MRENFENFAEQNSPKILHRGEQLVLSTQQQIKKVIKEVRTRKQKGNDHCTPQWMVFA